MPGLLLSGWAPARAAVRPVHLVLRDVAAADARSLRRGVDLGLADVVQSAAVLQAPLMVHRAGSEPVRAVPGRETAVQVVVATEDDRLPAEGAVPCGLRIYTCPLDEWRPDTWSVASPASAPETRALRLDWHRSLDTVGAAQLNARFERRTGQPMDEAAWHGWMAVKVAYESALRADAGEDDVLALRFDGHKGQPLRFSEDGHLIQPTCRLVAGMAHLAAPIDHDLYVDAD